MAWWRSWIIGRRLTPRTRTRSTRQFLAGRQESLEPRLLLTGSTVALQSISASDSKDLRVAYNIAIDPASLSNSPLPGTALLFSVYRSADATLDSGDLLLAQFGPQSIPATTGFSPVSAPTDPGTHTTTLSFSQALPTNLPRPYVIVAASLIGPSGEPLSPTSTASIHKHTLVIYAHGALQDEPGNRLPPWVVQFGTQLKQQGYEKVLLFNWVGDSWSPGRAGSNGPKLANQIRKTVAQFPAGEPVDIHLIGHSEGAVINSIALRNLERSPAPNAQGGTIQLTMLDPHPASSGSKFRDRSSKPNFMGWAIQLGTDIYQSAADDAPSAITQNVDSADIYYQHTYYAFASTSSWPWINLWGVVPVPNLSKIQPTYVDITGVGISHAGNFSVVDWYRKFVVPTLSSDTPYQPSAILTAQPDPSVMTITQVHPAVGQIPQRLDAITTTGAAQFAGSAWPGTAVRLAAAPRGQSVAHPLELGRAVANAQGEWKLKARQLHAGTYSVVASAVVPILPNHPRVKMTPRVRVGTLTVSAPHVLPRRQGQ